MLPTLEPGALFASKYRIKGELGRGGYAVVYEAEHTRLRQSVAIKVVHSGVHMALSRLEREARIIARLRSAHVVRIFDVDMLEDGTLYTVMERLHGEDLEHALAARTVTTPALVDWVVQACDVLEEAHDKGIVHRDLKPSNIFLCSSPEGRIAKVLDFGISKLLDASDTQTRGHVLGTPSYMAPEQFAAPKTVDGRSDLWALGVILYRGIDGEAPFFGETLEELALAILAVEPVHLLTRKPDVPPGLAEAVHRALNKNVANRFRTAAELADAIRPFGEGKAPLSRLVGDHFVHEISVRPRPDVGSPQPGLPVGGGDETPAKTTTDITNLGTETTANATTFSAPPPALPVVRIVTRGAASGKKLGTAVLGAAVVVGAVGIATAGWLARDRPRPATPTAMQAPPPPLAATDSPVAAAVVPITAATTAPVETAPSPSSVVHIPAPPPRTTTLPAAPRRPATADAAAPPVPSVHIPRHI